MSMDIQTSADKRLVPNAVLVRLREELGWGRPRLAKEFELVGRRHGFATPEPAAMEKQIYRLETGRTVHLARRFIGADQIIPTSSLPESLLSPV